MNRERIWGAHDEQRVNHVIHCGNRRAQRAKEWRGRTKGRAWLSAALRTESPALRQALCANNVLSEFLQPGGHRDPVQVRCISSSFWAELKQGKDYPTQMTVLCVFSLTFASVLARKYSRWRTRFYPPATICNKKIHCGLCLIANIHIVFFK